MPVYMLLQLHMQCHAHSRELRLGASETRSPSPRRASIELPGPGRYRHGGVTYFGPGPNLDHLNFDHATRPKMAPPKRQKPMRE